MLSGTNIYSNQWSKYSNGVSTITGSSVVNSGASNYFAMMFSGCSNFKLLDLTISVPATFSPSANYGQNMYGLIILSSSYLISRTVISTQNAGNGAQGGTFIFIFFKKIIPFYSINSIRSSRSRWSKWATWFLYWLLLLWRRWR